MKRSAAFIILVLLLLPLHLSGADPIVLQDSLEQYYLNRNYIEVLEDPEQKYSIDVIASPEFQNRFKKIPTEYPENQHFHSAYWIRFRINDLSASTNWILESYNFKIRDLELYVPSGNGKFEVKKSGADFPFYARTFNHKNFQFIIPAYRNSEKTYYLKFVSHYSSRVRFVIKSYEQFTSYSINEYFLLGMFYGIIFIMGMYNLLLYIRLKDIAYLYYAFYVFFVGLFSMVQDGTGFQYLWSGYPRWNNYSLFFHSTFMAVFALLYVSSFLETKRNYPKLHKIILLIIFLRIVVGIIEPIFITNFINVMWIDLIPFGVAYITSIISYRDRKKFAIYFVIGFTVLFIGNLLNTARLYKVIPSSVFTVYILNIAAVIEIILLSQALAERVKEIRESKLLKERMNKELEQKVRERTKALVIQKNIIEDKVHALDTFIYKASHDIKGPLKSLIGVATLGMQDNPENARIYFEHALKTARKLDAVVKDLMHITKISNIKIKFGEIDIQKMVDDVLENFRKLPGYEEMKIEVSVCESRKFISERTIIYSIIQNLIENAIKYRKPDAKEKALKIYANCNENICEMKFTDNGIGIPDVYQDKVFDMFFRVNTNSEDSTGLGLYIVKLGVEKLKGQIFLQSQEGQGSSFTIIFKNNYVPDTEEAVSNNL